MLGKIKRLFSSEQQELRLEDAREFLETRLGKEIIAAKDRLKAELKEAMKEYSELRRLYVQLAERGAGGFPNTVKAKLCNRALSLLDVQEPEVNYQAIMEFLRLSQENLKSIGSISYKEMIHLYAFKDEMNRIASQTKILIESLNSLARELDKSLLKEIGRAEKCLERIESSKRLKRELASDIETIEKETEGKRELLEERVKSLKEFSSLEQEISELRANLDKTETEMHFLDSKISEQFAGTEKILRRHKHDGKEKGMIDDYIKNATHAFLVLDRDLEIKDILDSIVEEKDLEEEKGFEKILQLRRDIEMLSAFRAQYLSLKEKKDENEEELLKLSSKASDKEYRLQDIQDVESEIKTLEKKKAEKEGEINSLDEKVKQDIQQLASLLNEFTGQRVLVAE